MKRRLTYFLLLAVFSSIGCSDTETIKDDIPQETYPIGYVSTRLGDMYFWLYDQTPIHKAKFIELAKDQHYNQFTFNRVVRNFVIQGGCPDSVSYFENSPFLIDPEFHDSIGHSYGALGMGRDDNPKKQSNACQFYIVSKEAGLPQLDSNYMIFGMIIKGQDVLESIEMEQTNAADQPLEEIPLNVQIKYYSEISLLDSLGFKLP
ncbi:MAG: peptidyl-prolyl cis-trans isomerase B (cyclophilin B) [Bacteroidia bacterium]|jgi:peptidyl-prolyl cis-trans isomerase B (cyclophilin B)